MSGGGDSKPKTPATPAATPQPTPGQTVQPFMPGMDTMLAQQLAAGGYGNMQDLLAQFQQIYTPMTMPAGNVAPPTTTTPTTTPAPSGQSGSSAIPNWLGNGFGGPKRNKSSGVSDRGGYGGAGHGGRQ